MTQQTETVLAHWKSSMNKIRLTENKDGTYNLTFIDDVTHGYRTFILAKEDIETIFASK